MAARQSFWPGTMATFRRAYAILCVVLGPRDRPHGERPRPAEAFFAPDFSGPDDGVPDPMRADPGRALPADLDRVPGQPGAQRPDHWRAPDRHRARFPAGDPAVSRG